MGVKAPAWVRSKIGRSFIFASFSPKNAGALEAMSSSSELISTRDTTLALRALVGAALGMGTNALEALGLTDYSLRHGGHVTRTCHWPTGPVGKQGESAVAA
jgi:hypothetical protein